MNSSIKDRAIFCLFFSISFIVSVTLYRLSLNNYLQGEKPLKFKEVLDRDKREVDTVTNLATTNLDNGMLTEEDRDAVMAARCRLCCEAIYLGDEAYLHEGDHYCSVECLLIDLQVAEITVEDYLV